MNEAVIIAGVESTRIRYNGRPICTTAQLALFYGCSERNLTDNFQRNAQRFEEDKHYVKLEGQALQAFRDLYPADSGVQISPMVRSLYLWTELGAAHHAKMLTTDRAWAVFEEMEDAYFRGKEASALPRARQDHSGLPEFRRARALDLATKTAERITAQFPNISEDSRRVIFAKVINPVAGFEILSLPRIEDRHYSAGEVGGKLGITGAMVGRIANLHNLKTPENGEYRLDKSQHSSKQVETWVYNDKGVEAVRLHMASSGPRLAAAAGAIDGQPA